MLPAPTVVSLFTGAGGLDIGLERAGFRCVAATDADDDCIATLVHNQAARVPIAGTRGACYLEGASIRHARVEDLRPGDLAPDSAGPLWSPDLLAGGPPCQPFSSSGKQHGLDDPRGRLFEHFVELAEGLKPRFVLFENVRGLVTARGPSGEPGEALRLVRREFERIGYATRFALLNAADFGAAQRRVRLFMYGSRDSALPHWPPATHSRCPAAGLFGHVAPWITLGEFLAAREPPPEPEVVRPTPALAASLTTVPDGSGLRSAGAREATRPGGHWGYRQGTFVADLTKPARTVTAATSQDWVRIGGDLRRLTVSECAALQGFPERWHFVGGVASRMRQVGNAVPVRLGEVLGVQIARAVTGAPSGRRAASDEFPSEFTDAIDYTKREDARNGRSRREVRERQTRTGAALASLKGTGAIEYVGRVDRG